MDKAIDGVTDHGVFFFFQAEDGIRDKLVTGVQTCALPIFLQPSQTLWVGGEGGMEEDLVKRAGIPYRSIPAAGVHGVGLRKIGRASCRERVAIALVVA